MSAPQEHLDEVEIRRAVPSDAENLLELKLALDHESSFMMFEPRERTASVAAVRAEIEQRLARHNSTLIVAALPDLIAGYVEAYGGGFNRTRHSAVVVAGVRASHSGRGIGSRLFQSLTDWADGAGIVRLELTVMAHNARAVWLYEKHGFEAEGVRRCSMLVDGVCVDELAMARIRPDFAASDRNE